MAAKVKAGDAFVQLSTEGSIKRGLRQAGMALQGFGRQIAAVAKVAAGLGAGLAAGLGAATVTFANAASHLGKLSTQTGDTVENWSRMSFAARQLGIDVDDMTGAVEELNIRLGEAIQDGTGPLLESFRKLGLDAEEIAAMPLPERIGKIADALKGLSRTDRGFLADEIFGGDAFKVMELLDQGSAGIRRLAEEADRLGATLSAEDAENARKFVAVWRDIKEAVRAAVIRIGSELGPVLNDMLDKAVPKMAQLVAWFKDSGADKFASALKGAVKVVDFLAKAWNGVVIAFRFVQLGMTSLVLLAIKGFNAIADLFSRVVNDIQKQINKILPERFEFEVDEGPGAVRGFMKTFEEELQRSVAEIKKDIDARLSPAAAPSTTGEDAAQRRRDEYLEEAQQFAARTLATSAVADSSTARGTFSAAAATMLGRAGGVDKEQLEEMRKANVKADRLFALLNGPGGNLRWAN